MDGNFTRQDGAPAVARAEKALAIGDLAQGALAVVAIILANLVIVRLVDMGLDALVR